MFRLDNSLTGLNHPLDGVVILAEVEQRDNDGRVYRAEVDGKQRSLVVYAQSYWSPTDYTACIPGQQEPHAIKADEERCAAINVDGLVAEMEYLCLSDASFKQQVKEISEVSCGFADALNLSRDDQTLVFQTSEDASNQRETINDFLQTL